jgi:beta-glucuronidase
MLKPIENAARERKCLNGLWDFAVDAQARGRAERWWSAPLQRSDGAREIAVPSSYNDLFADAAVRDHVGDVWYQTEVFVPASWAGRRTVLRFDAATHRAVVWVDDAEVMRHEGGYTPFEDDVSARLTPGRSHRVTVCVNNELHWHTIPPGRVVTLADGRRRQQVFHDFFNYAGLHRPVWLYSTPTSHITDVTVNTAYAAGRGTVDYQLAVSAGGTTRARLRDAAGAVVATSEAK